MQLGQVYVDSNKRHKRGINPSFVKLSFKRGCYKIKTNIMKGVESFIYK